MDKVIRISSEQGFAASWNSTAGGGTDPTTLNLCDFRIPRGLVVDLSKSYIAFNTQIRPTIAGNFTSADDVINSNMIIEGINNEQSDRTEVPNVCLIKNADISCDRGQIESIRRVDTLRSTLWNIEHDAEDRQDDMNAMTAPKSVRGDKNQTSYFLNPCITNSDGAGGVITGRTSRNLTRDVKVPIKDIFGIGQAEDWNTSKFGETRIHLETNWKDVRSYELGGFEDVTNAFDQTNTWGACDAQAIPNLAAAGKTSTLTLTFLYDDFELFCPFFVGQHILCSAGVDSGTAPTDVPAVISAMKYDPATAKVTITTAAAWYTNGETTVNNLTTILIKSDIAVTPQMAVNRAELVLYTKPDRDTEDSYEYVTYTTEQDNGNGLKDFARGYVMEPSARNMIVCLCNNGEKLPTTNINSYRYAVNNEGMTGNRDIRPNSAIQYDRLTRCLDSTGMGTDWRNAQLKWFTNGPAILQPASYQNNGGNPEQCAVIAETLMLTDRPKYVDIQIASANADTLQELIIYKQHVRSI